MRQGKAFHWSIAAGWFVTALAALLVATIVIPEESRSPYFWHRVCWTEFLVFLFWGSSGLYLLASGQTRDHISRFGGIAPTISIVIAFYALLSFGVMMIHAFVPATDAGNRIHLIAQVVFFAVAALCIVVLSMARTGAAAGLEFDKTKAKSPRELHDVLALHESCLPSGDADSSTLRVMIKQLRETLLYSLNGSAALAESTEYKSLSAELERFCFLIKRQHDLSEDGKVCESDLVDMAKRLITKAQYVSSSQAKR